MTDDRFGHSYRFAIHWVVEWWGYIYGDWRLAGADVKNFAVFYSPILASFPGLSNIVWICGTQCPQGKFHYHTA